MAGIFKAYDIRGERPTEINADVVRKIGYAFGQYLGGERIVIGHDMREASPELAQAFSEGIMACRMDIDDIGLATTPMLYYAIIDGEYNGGAMVTASHLPVHYNGVKLCRERAIPLSGDSGLPEVEQRFNEIDQVPDRLEGEYRKRDFVGRYVDRLLDFVEPSEPLKIVVDAGNGMGGLDTPRLIEHLPRFQFIQMYMQLDGSFPHHVPNPVLPETTADLQERVVDEQADAGIAFDGDGDRCGFIDEKGSRVPADLAIAVMAEYILHTSPGATVLYDLRASRAVPERIQELGGKPVKTRVGHSFIKAKMREVDAVFAGELSGHYYFREMGFIDNGILAMITMLNLLSLKGQPLSEFISPLQKYAQSGEINFKVDDRDALFEELQQHYQDGEQEHLDGLSVNYSDWWFNMRSSHTEPVVRLVIEADDEQTLEKHQSELFGIIGKYGERQEE